MILDDAMKYHTASACIPASCVKQATEYVKGNLPVCTVIGFPIGCSTTATKVFETKDAVANGASEIDMVLNIGFLKDRSHACTSRHLVLRFRRKNRRLEKSGILQKSG